MEAMTDDQQESVDPAWLTEAVEAAAQAVSGLDDEGWQRLNTGAQASYRRPLILAIRAAAPIIEQAVLQVCSCQAWPPEGPAPDCAVHGAVRAFNETAAQLAEVIRERDEALGQLVATKRVVKGQQEVLDRLIQERDDARAEREAMRRVVDAARVVAEAEQHQGHYSAVEHWRRTLDLITAVDALPDTSVVSDADSAALSAPQTPEQPERAKGGGT
jgi:hypothetical protein